MLPTCLLLRVLSLVLALSIHNKQQQSLGFGLVTSSVSTEIVWDNRNASVGTTEIENRIFGYFFFCLSRACSGGSGFYSRLNLLGVTQSVFFMVPGETQTSTSPTASGITSGTPCGGGDGPSSTVLGSSGHESTDSNTASVVSTTSGTHVGYGCNTVTTELQNVKQSKKKTQETELIKRPITEWELEKPSSTRNKVWDQTFKYDKCPKGTPNGWEHHTI